MTALTNIDMEWTQSGMQFLTWKEGSLKKKTPCILCQLAELSYVPSAETSLMQQSAIGSPVTSWVQRLSHCQCSVRTIFGLGSYYLW